MNSQDRTRQKNVAVLWEGQITACRQRVATFFREAAMDGNLASFYLDSTLPSWKRDLVNLDRNLHLDYIFTGSELAPQIRRLFARRSRRPQLIAPVADDPINFPHAYIDNAAIAREAAKFLLGRGYQNLAYVGCTDAHTHSRQRELSFRQTATALGAHYAGSISTSISNPVDSTLLTFLRNLPKPCGLFAYHDPYARNLITFCHIHGFAVPDVFAIVGADDDDDVCEASSPSITSVHIDFETISRYACRLIRDGADAARQLPLPAVPYVHERDSTRPKNSHMRLVNLSLSTIRQCHGRITVRELMRQLNVSERMLRLSFQKVLGHGAKKAILDYRLQVAKRLLKNTDLPVNEIAAEAAFPDPANFYTHFTATCGLSPTAWRHSSSRS